MNLNFDVNLKGMALVSTAATLWNLPDINTEKKMYFCTTAERGKIRWWYELIGTVVKKIPKEFPHTLYPELVEIVQDMGLKINDWFRFLKRRRIFCTPPCKSKMCEPQMDSEKLYEIYAKPIYWSSNGMIDEIRILKSWMRNPDADLTKVYVMSCYFCAEELIRELWGKISKDLLTNKNKRRRYWGGLHLADYWISLFQSDLKGFIGDYASKSGYSFAYKENRSLEVNMFFLSIEKNCALAVKYFWGKMTWNEKRDYYSDGFSRAVNAYSRCATHPFFYRGEQIAEIVRLLMNDMIHDVEYFHEVNMLFFAQRSVYDHNTWRASVFLMFATSSPMNIFSKDILDKFQRIFISSDYLDIIQTVAYRLYKIREFECFNRDRFRKILGSVWLSMPPSMWNDYDAFYFLFILKGVEDIRLANFIFYEKRMKYVIFNPCVLVPQEFYHPLIRTINKDHLKFMAFLEKDNLDFLFERQVVDMFLPKEWKLSRPIREIIKTLHNFLLNSDFISAEKILNDVNEDEKKFYRNNVNVDLVTIYFIIKNELKSADSFLDWIFSADSEKVNYYKSSFRDERKSFTINFILNSWESVKENFEILSDRLENFLLWFCFDSLVLENFKKRLLRDFKREILNKFFIESNRFDLFHRFLQFLGAENPIQEARALVDGKIYDEKFGIYMKKNAVKEAQWLLEWMFDSEKERKSYVRDFMTEKNGLKFCKLFIGKYCGYKDREEKLKKFVDYFVSPLENFDELKREIKRNWPEENIFGLDPYTSVRSLFEKDPYSSAEEDSEVIRRRKIRNGGENCKVKILCLSDESDEECKFHFQPVIKGQGDIYWFDQSETFHDIENKKIFLSLLDSLEKKRYGDRSGDTFRLAAS